MKKLTKRMICLALVLVMTCGIFAGCSTKKTQE